MTFTNAMQLWIIQLKNRLLIVGPNKKSRSEERLFL